MWTTVLIYYLRPFICTLFLSVVRMRKRPRRPNPRHAPTSSRVGDAADLRTIGCGTQAFSLRGARPATSGAQPPHTGVFHTRDSLPAPHTANASSVTPPSNNA